MARRDNDPRDGMVVFPNAQPEIFAHFGSPYWTSHTLNGELRPLPSISLLSPRYWPYRHVNGPNVDWFLMQLTPLGCAVLVDAPMAALIGPDIDLSAVIGSPAGNLFDRLATAQTFEERCAVAQEWASNRQGAVQMTCPTISKIVDDARARTIDSLNGLSASLGISDRQFRHRFRSEIGISPKKFFSLMRAERLWTNAPPRFSPTNLYEEYSDQSHAAREFRRFTGFTMTDYLNSKSNGDNLVNGLTL